MESLRNTKALVHRVIFGTDTPAGKGFDILLIFLIVTSVLAVILESVASIRQDYLPMIKTAEWVFTILFSIEYLLRLWCVERPLKYATSFFGIVDLIAVVPTYLSLLIVNTQYHLVIRTLRLLRVFRILKLVQYMNQAHILMRALSASRAKITIFLFTVFNLVIIIGALMYVVEGEVSGFTSIPKGIYWAIVTLTTVGYGDISPQTPIGQFLASVVMVMGYGIIAVPTGIMTVEISRASQENDSVREACSACGGDIHPFDAKYCHHCGHKL